MEKLSPVTFSPFPCYARNFKVAIQSRNELVKCPAIDTISTCVVGR